MIVEFRGGSSEKLWLILAVFLRLQKCSVQVAWAEKAVAKVGRMTVKVGARAAMAKAEARGKKSASSVAKWAISRGNAPTRAKGLRAKEAKVRAGLARSARTPNANGATKAGCRLLLLYTATNSGGRAGTGSATNEETVSEVTVSETATGVVIEVTVTVAAIANGCETAAGAETASRAGKGASGTIAVGGTTTGTAPLAVLIPETSVATSQAERVIEVAETESGAESAALIACVRAKIKMTSAKTKLPRAERSLTSAAVRRRARGTNPAVSCRTKTAAESARRRKAAPRQLERATLATKRAASAAAVGIERATAESEETIVAIANVVLTEVAVVTETGTLIALGEATANEAVVAQMLRSTHRAQCAAVAETTAVTAMCHRKGGLKVHHAAVAAVETVAEIVAETAADDTRDLLTSLAAEAGIGMAVM